MDGNSGGDDDVFVLGIAGKGKRDEPNDGAEVLFIKPELWLLTLGLLLSLLFRGLIRFFLAFSNSANLAGSICFGGDASSCSCITPPLVLGGGGNSFRFVVPDREGLGSVPGAPAALLSVGCVSGKVSPLLLKVLLSLDVLLLLLCANTF